MLSTIIVGILFAIAVVAVIVKMVRDKMQGKSSCGCGSSCGSCTGCDINKNKEGNRKDLK